MGSKKNQKPSYLPRPKLAEVGAALGLILLFMLMSGWRPVLTSYGTSINGVIRVSQEVQTVPDAEEYPEQPDDAERNEPTGEIDSQSSVDDKREELEIKSLELMEKVLTGEEEIKRSGPSSKAVAALGGLIFKDGAEYEAAPNVTIPPVPLSKRDYSRLWYLQKMHDEFFEKYPHKLYIPTLDQPISRLEFYQRFIQTSTPVKVPFEHMRHLGVLTKGWTIEELRQRFPYNPGPKAKRLNYHARAGLSGQSLDLGPALYELSQDAELKKGAKGTSLRNFPRNLMIKPKYLALLDVAMPPFLPKSRFQVPTLWMGTSTADTKLHHDCCDNFVFMIAGTKKWYIAPPPQSRNQMPVLCTGKHQSLCWSSLKYPNEDRDKMTPRNKNIMDKTQSMVIELKAGEMLFLPAGWWHHIENVGPTVMVNFWSRGCSNSAVALDFDPLRRDRPDFQNCPAVAQKTNDFLNS